jgi:hypothetical protein
MVRKKVRSALSKVLAWVVLAICLSCAKSPYINVDYRQTTERRSVITEKPVYIECVDLRRDKAILNEKAKKQFPDFSGEFSLTLKVSDNQQTPMGNYTLPRLFETAFSNRLKQLGVPTSDQPSSDILTLHVEINRFQISLVGRDWAADIGYTASLNDLESRIASETVTGSAQRYKGLGRGGAEKVTGEIFTDAINRLNIERLFSKATVN